MDDSIGKGVGAKKPALSKKTPRLLILGIVVFIIGGVTLWAVIHKRETDTNVYEKSVSLADDYLAKKEYADALENYYEAAKIKPSEIKPYQGIITILLDKNLPDKLGDYITVAQYHLSEEDLNSLYKQIGQYYYANREWDKALENYEGISDSAMTEDDEIVLADIYMHTGDLDKAKEVFDRYPDSESDPSKVWASYSRITTKTKLFDVAKESQSLLNDGYPNLVVALLSAREKEMNNYWEGNYYLGRAYWEIDDTENALKYLEKADSLNAIDSGVYLYLARIYNEKGETTNSDDYYGRALSFSNSSDRAQILYEYIETLSSESRYNTGLDIMSVFATDSIDSDYQYFLLYLGNGSEENTLKYLNKIEKSLTDGWDYYDKFLYQAGDFYLSKSNLGKAHIYETKLFERDEFSPYGYLLKGESLLENGDYEAAKAALESSIEYDINGSVSSEAKRQLDLIAE
ncbi:tetratricopeptide repeat protein [Candidatus Nomurabacteria bacterium]|nr:tetratricopeptide repeat protein [Candidatus Nomurabacteria bacterium]